MKKLLIAASILAALVVIVVVVASFMIGTLVRTGITTIGPQITGTPVGLEQARLSVVNGSGTLTGLTVGNPAGWQSDHAFSLGRIHLDLAPMSVFGDTIIIDEITIERPHFVYETKLISSNIKDLLAHIEKATGGSSSAAPSDGGTPRKFIIKKLSLSDGEVTLGASVAAITLPMPPILLTDLGVRENGITAGAIATAVMQSVLSDIGVTTAKAAVRIGAASGSAGADAIGAAAQKAGEGLRKLFGPDAKEPAKAPDPKP